MPRQWQPVVEQFADVQKLVHLASRMDTYDAERIRAELLRDRRAYYEAELTDQAARVGCPGRVGRLGNPERLSILNELSQIDATGIVNTYNYDLAAAVAQIRSETPTANRHVYAKRLREWDAKRSQWKQPQIATYTETTARSMAQSDFYMFNPSMGVATLQPTRAVCPVCQGWVNRGEVPLHVAQANPPPYHTNCFPPDAPVTMPDGGERQIGEITAGEAVASRLGTTQVIRVFQRHTEEALYRVAVHGREIRLTGDHPVLTVHGWRPARDLQVGELLALGQFHEGAPDGK